MADFAVTEVSFRSGTLITMACPPSLTSNLSVDGLPQPLSSFLMQDLSAVLVMTSTGGLTCKQLSPVIKSELMFKILLFLGLIVVLFA